MAAIFNHSDFWRMNSNASTVAILKLAGTNFYKLQGILLCLICPIILVGNTFLINTMWKDRPSQPHRFSPCSLILRSMALADLLVGLISCPFTACWFLTLGYHHKLLWSLPRVFSLTATFVGASFGHVVLLIIERYFAVVKPLKYKFILTSGRAKGLIALVWIVFISFGITIFVLIDSFFIIQVTFYIVKAVLSGISIGLYVATVFSLYKSSNAWRKRIQDNNGIVLTKQNYIITDKDLVKVVAVLLLVSLLIVIPYFLVVCLLYFCAPCLRYGEQLLYAMFVLSNMDPLQSAVNPFLYFWRIPKYRAAFKRFLRKVFIRRSSNVKTFRDKNTFDTRL